MVFLSSRGAISAIGQSQFGSGTDLPMLLDNVVCTGSEGSLRECTHNGWGTHNCLASEAAGVICEPNPGQSECMSHSTVVLLKMLIKTVRINSEILKRIESKPELTL